MKALLIGKEPAFLGGYTFVSDGSHDGVVIGSLTLGQLLHFDNEQVLSALAEGKMLFFIPPVCRRVLKTGDFQPPLPPSGGN